MSFRKFLIFLAVPFLITACENFVWHGDLLEDFENYTTSRVILHSYKEGSVPSGRSLLSTSKRFRLGQEVSVSELNNSVSSWNNEIVRVGGWQKEDGTEVSSVEISSEPLELTAVWHARFTVNVYKDNVLDHTYYAYGKIGSSPSVSPAALPDYNTAKVTYSATTIFEDGSTVAEVRYSKFVHVYIVDKDGNSVYSGSGSSGTDVSAESSVIPAGKTVLKYVNMDTGEEVSYPSVFPSEDLYLMVYYDESSLVSGYKTIYLNTSSGNDSNDGLTSAAPVKTVADAKSKAMVLSVSASEEREICVQNTISLSSDIAALDGISSGTKPVILRRSDTFTGTILDFKSAATLANVTIDGNSSVNKQTDSPLIVNNSSYAVTLNYFNLRNNVLKDNCEAKGTAVYAEGHIELYNCTISVCSAAFSGSIYASNANKGAVYIKGKTSRVYNSSISGCIGCSGIVYVNKDLSFADYDHKINNCNIKGNARYGVYFSAKLSVEGGNISGNMAGDIFAGSSAFNSYQIGTLTIIGPKLPAETIYLKAVENSGSWKIGIIYLTANIDTGELCRIIYSSNYYSPGPHKVLYDDTAYGSGFVSSSYSHFFFGKNGTDTIDKNGNTP